MRYLFQYIVITRSVHCSSKCTRNRLATWLRPDTLGELERSPDSLVVLGAGRGPQEGWERMDRRGGKEEEGRRWKGRKGREGKEGEGRGGEGTEGKGSRPLAP